MSRFAHEQTCCNAGAVVRILSSEAGHHTGAYAKMGADEEESELSWVTITTTQNVLGTLYKMRRSKPSQVTKTKCFGLYICG